ncbi:MAG: outer membrane protein assembly factor BamE [Pseudomonadota bacterium]|jgi:hypothetical protein
MGSGITQRAARIFASAAALAGLVFGLALPGCDARREARLQPGQATEQEVLREFGTPVAIRGLPEGQRRLEFSAQPEGTTNHVATIGADGRLVQLRQLLQPEGFAQVRPGMTVEQVREQLGPPALKEAYALKKEEVWDWRWQDGPTRRIFRVTFDFDGRVLSAAAMDDPRDLYR